MLVLVIKTSSFTNMEEESIYFFVNSFMDKLSFLNHSVTEEWDGTKLKIIAFHNFIGPRVKFYKSMF